MSDIEAPTKTWTADEIEWLLANTTPGPWTASGRCSGSTLDDDEGAGLGFEIEGPPEPMLRGQFSKGPDARLIAATPDLARQLLALLRKHEDVEPEAYSAEWMSRESIRRFEEGRK